MIKTLIDFYFQMNVRVDIQVILNEL
jgi:hypothetical protein